VPKITLEKLRSIGNSALGCALLFVGIFNSAFAAPNSTWGYPTQAEAEAACLATANAPNQSWDSATCTLTSGFYVGYYNWYTLIIVRQSEVFERWDLFPGIHPKPCSTCEKSAKTEAALGAYPICHAQDGSTTPNPIDLVSAEKYRNENDWSDSGPSPLSFSRTYRSSWGFDPNHPNVGLGQSWTHNHAFRLVATPSETPTDVAIVSPEGQVQLFSKATGSSSWAATGSADTLTQIASGAWVYRSANDDATLSFSAEGKLVGHVARNGWMTAYAYDGVGRLATVANSFGRSISLSYNAAGQLATLTTADARVVSYAHDSLGRLSSVAYPDNTARTFLYENAAFPQALTGINSETGARWGTFAYDAKGRSIGSELAGGVERYQVAYPANGNPGSTVTDPLGTGRTYWYTIRERNAVVSSGSLPSASDADDAQSRTQGTNGLVTSQTDFKGVVTTTSWDVARRLPTSVTRASGTPEAQTVTTQWHPTFSLPALVTESGRSTAYTYDALGNVLTKHGHRHSHQPGPTLAMDLQRPAAGSHRHRAQRRRHQLHLRPPRQRPHLTNALGHVTSLHLRHRQPRSQFHSPQRPSPPPTPTTCATAC
jgi:YD repeat-containing protein